MLTELLKNLNDIPVLYSFAYPKQPRINLLSLAISGVLEKKKKNRKSENKNECTYIIEILLTHFTYPYRIYLDYMSKLVQLTRIY